MAEKKVRVCDVCGRAVTVVDPCKIVMTADGVNLDTWEAALCGRCQKRAFRFVDRAIHAPRWKAGGADGPELATNA